MTAPQSELDLESIYCGILIRTQRAFQFAQFSAGLLANALAVNSETAYLILESENTLFDEHDTVFDVTATQAAPKCASCSEAGVLGMHEVPCRSGPDR
jgi:hypothetical protein